MAKKSKQPEFVHCKVVSVNHPRTPWRVSYPVEIDGVTRRKRRMFSTEDKAKEFAAGHEKDVKDFGVRFGSITAAARRAYDFYRDAKADLLADGVEPPSFESLVADAVAVLRREHEDRKANKMTIAEAVAVFLEYKRPRVSDKHLNAMKSQFKTFSKTFGTDPFDKPTGHQIETWIMDLPGIGKVTRNKMRKILKSLFAYGCIPERGWRQSNPLTHIDPEPIKRGEPEAYTADEVTKIMETALDIKSPALPELALGFFAGLRPSESMAVDLANIDLNGDCFKVPADTKTGARIAPLTPACKAWLAAQTRRTGKAWESTQRFLSDEINAILKLAKVRTIYDGRRHSFISHRTAELGDVGKVSDECGNSAAIIKKHYRQIVTAAAAEKYFAIRPPVIAENVTNITEGRKTA